MTLLAYLFVFASVLTGILSLSIVALAVLYKKYLLILTAFIPTF